MVDRPESIRVNIYGREYSIRGDDDPGYIAEIAHFVDMKMRQMTDNITMASTAKVAILTALNIADELFQKERQVREHEETHSAILAGLAERIEKALAEPSHEPTASDQTNERTVEVTSFQTSTSPENTFTG
jgi:cell division protein ZapA